MERLNMNMNEKELYLECLANGVDLSVGRRLTLCDLRNSYQGVKIRKYQVHCDKTGYSTIFFTPEEAVEAFIALKKQHR